MLYVDGENPLHMLRERLASIIEALGADRQTVYRNLSLLARMAQAVDGELPNPALALEGEELMRLVAAEGPAMVVLDNLSTLTGIDLSDGKSYTPIQRRLQQLIGQGLGVVVVTHARKAQQGQQDSYLGTSKQGHVLNTALQVVKVPKTATCRETKMVLKVRKWRRKDHPAARDAAIAFRDRDGNEPARWTWEPEVSEELAAVLEGLRLCEYPNQTKLGEALGLTQGQVSDRLKAARGAGLLTIEEQNRSFKAAQEGKAREAIAEF